MQVQAVSGPLHLLFLLLAALARLSLAAYLLPHFPSVLLKCSESVGRAGGWAHTARAQQLSGHVMAGVTQEQSPPLLGAQEGM